MENAIEKLYSLLFSWILISGIHNQLISGLLKQKIDSTCSLNENWKSVKAKNAIQNSQQAPLELPRNV